MEGGVICYIQAFNCEKTIEAAMQSVLNQTYGNWLCFVLSNGNRTNFSFDIIKEFAARDSRFVVLNKELNTIAMYSRMLYHLAQSFPSSYICSLDADDEYKSDFFERGVALMEAHNLDIVACGAEIVQKPKEGSKRETLLGRREVNKDLIINKVDYASLFPVYKSFFNEMWGKLYRASALYRKDSDTYVEKKIIRHFLPDTLFTIDALSRASAIGVLSNTSYKFYQFSKRAPTNATTQTNAVAANEKRYGLFFFRSRFSVYLTYETIMDFLRAHGGIDEELYEYMQAVLFGWFGDFYARTLLLTTDEKEVAEHAERLVFNEKFVELMTYRDSGKYDNLKKYEKRIAFCGQLRNYLVGQKEIRNRKIGWRLHLRCTKSTMQKLDRVVATLDDTVVTLQKLQGKNQ